jgi:hypothetical protein
MDKAIWQAFVESGAEVPAGHSVDELTPELLAYLGSTDPFLRDEVAYPVLDGWIHGGQYSDDRLRELLEQLEPNLALGLGGAIDDSVFLRTFSILVANEILEEDNLRPFLDEPTVRGWLDRALDYLLDERDLRGYVGKKGWAHSAAHTADTLWVLSRSRFVGAPELARILDAIAAKISAQVEHVYLYGEDQRLATAVMSALRRDLLAMPFLTDWLARLAAPPGRPAWREFYRAPADASAYANTKLFLRSLYFQLLLGTRVPGYHPEPAYLRRPPAVRDQLLPALVDTMRALEPAFYREKSDDDA